MQSVSPFVDESDGWEDLKSYISNELDQVNEALDEVNLMLEQSQLEVTKLAQKNASITTKLQQIQGHFDTVPREDIRSVYDRALETQQRLFVMRGQLEKLQSDQAQLNRYKNSLEQVNQAFQGGVPESVKGNAHSGTVEIVESMIQAQEAERQRLSRQMHDGPAQALSNFILQTEIAMRYFDLDQGKSRAELSSLKSAATNTFGKVRDFIFELRPMMLDDLGLVPTVQRYIEAIQEQHSTEIRFTFTGNERRLESYQEIMVFRALQELVSNAIRHSQAAQINIQLDLGESAVKMIIDDNGMGFDEALLEQRGHLGIKVIKERVEMLGGYLQVDSVIGQGTRITFQMPVTNIAAIA